MDIDHNMSDDEPAPPLAIAGAITYPTGPSGSNEEGTNAAPAQPRQPHNLQGLMRFAMEATLAEDAPRNSGLQPMDEERRRFLEEAMRSLTVDVAKVLRESIKKLSDSELIRAVQDGDEVPDEIQVAFNNLMEFIDDIDIANDFYKLGGFAVFPVCFDAQNETIRARACELIAELCQNNPYCQERTLETGLLNILINMADNEQLPYVLAKTIYGLSCATREFEPACKEFIDQNGCAVLIKVLRVPNVQVRTKAAFLVRYFCKNFHDAKEHFIQNNLVRVLAELISEGKSEASEHILGTLSSIVEDKDPKILEQCRNPELDLKSSLEKYLLQPCLQGETDFIEEKEYSMELLEVCGSGARPSDDAGVER